MSISDKLAGAFAPILTPFTGSDKRINWDSYRSHLGFLEKTGLKGILVLGTNGEFGNLSIDERIQLVETTISANSALNIIVGGVVPDSPAKTMDFVAQLADYADQLTAVLVTPPPITLWWAFIVSSLEYRIAYPFYCTMYRFRWESRSLRLSLPALFLRSVKKRSSWESRILRHAWRIFPPIGKRNRAFRL